MENQGGYMKRAFSTVLVLVFILGIAGTALAASANPFADVPAKHWAYDAIGKLAGAGIVDGYGDATFRGDRTMTRYEMAQIVAKAMARSEKADAANKALIDKLATEFAAELNNLGVRMAKLEEKTKIGINYESRIRYAGDSEKTTTGTSTFDWRQRVIFGGAVNENVSFGARLEASDKAGTTASSTIAFNRAYFDVKNFLGAVDNFRIGRFGTGGITNGLLNYQSSNNDGFILTKKLGAATFNGMMIDVGNNSQVNLFNLDFKVADNVKMNVGYETTNLAKIAWPFTTATDYKTTSYDVGAQVQLGAFTLTGEYVSTKDKINNTTPKAYALQITNGVTGLLYPEKDLVNYSKPHTDAFAISYRSIENNAVPYMSGFKKASPICISTLAQDNDVKGYYITYQNVVSKGIIWTVEYQSLKQKADVAAAQKDNLWNTHFQFFF